jgi:transposase
MDVTTIGLDLAKSIFQVHGVDANGRIVIRKSLRRGQMLPFFARLPSCLVGMEACGTSHYWARELIKLGHEVRLMPPAYVKPYVKRSKTSQNERVEASVVNEWLRTWRARTDNVRFTPDENRHRRTSSACPLL